jgi:predicted metal-binding protein
MVRYFLIEDYWGNGYVVKANSMDKAMFKACVLFSHPSCVGVVTEEWAKENIYPIY